MMYDPILAAARESAHGYGSLPFWSWNDRLEPDELRRQIRAMHKIGMHGFFMHARGGLETEYLSDEWFAAVAASVDEAKKLGMEAWSYDENGWPSGFAGGALLTDPDNHARFLAAAVEDAYPTGDDVLGVWRIADGVCSPAAPEDPAPYHVVRERADASYVDVLRADITAKFLAATHAEYKRRTGADFGGAMPGFFTDEPQYYRWATPYSRSLPAKFAEKFGYPVFDALPALFWDFEGASAYRYDYYLLLHELFINCFIRPIYEWCDENGCRLTGHAVEESTLFGQMWCCGGVMEFYRYEHIPGIDYLGRGMQSDLAPKQLGSVCAQLGKKKALSEMFACCGWDVSPRELKRIAELQYAGGVNLMCQHLYPYSERGQRKRDYPAHFSEHNPWQSDMAEFDLYFQNLGALLAAGAEDANTLVIHPIRAAYCDYKRAADRASIAQLEDDTLALVRRLGEAQIPYHFGDEGMMEELASVEGARLRVGECVYDYVIVPKMRTVSKNTAALLAELIARGGRVCFIGGVPGEIDGRAADTSALRGTVSFDAIRAAAPVFAEKDGEAIPALRQRVRVVNGRRLVYTVNLGETDVFGARLHIKSCAAAAGVSVDTLETYPLAGEARPDGSLVLSLDLHAGEACVVLEDAHAALLPWRAPLARAAAIRLPEAFRLVRPLTNVLTLDRVSVSVDGGASWTEERPLERVRDNLLAERYEGALLLKYAFRVTDVPAAASLVWEGAGIEAVTVNGHPVRADGYLRPDRAFLTADIAPHLRAGENAAVLSLRYYQRPEVYDVLFGGAMESLRNCLCFDTEIENVYVTGDFRVAADAAKFEEGARKSLVYTGDFAIAAPRATVDLRDMVRDGLPFYGGEVVGEAEFEWHAGDATVFRPEGRYAVAEIWVNGARAGKAFFADEVELAPLLREGVNTLRIRAVNALRNTVGPFHRHDPEPYSVGPVTFSYEKQWHGGECGDYLPRYAFVKYGV